MLRMRLFDSFAASVKRRAVSRTTSIECGLSYCVVVDHEMLLTLLFAFSNGDAWSRTQMAVRKDGWRQN